MTAGLLVFAGAWAQQQISVVVNGQQVQFQNAGPRQERGRVLVPLRGVLEEMGAYVGWDPATRMVTASKGDLNIKMAVGSTMANVNGKSVLMDVPAEIIDGTTMVPLRFMSEVLGAKVQWLEASQTVQIDTALIEAAESTPPVTTVIPSAVARINSFTADHSGFFAAGTNVHFTLMGTPGGQATFEIPGVANDIPMRETQSGTYEGDWALPAVSQQGLELKETTALAHLTVGNTEQIAQTGTTFSIDTRPPLISGMLPNTQGETRARPRIYARLDDGAGSGVDTSTVQPMLDGEDMTNQATVTPGSVEFRPTNRLSPGTHRVSLYAKDMAGNKAVANWSFVVADDRTRSRELTFTSLPDYPAGSVVRVSLDAEPNSTVTFSIGDKYRDLPMREREPGHYTGQYTVQDGDYFYNDPVQAHLRTSAGREYFLEADQRMGMRTMDLRQPLFDSPKEGQTVTSPIVIRGRAAPYSTVLIHIAYSSLVLMDTIRIHGALADISLQADRHGNFQSQPIDLDRIRGANADLTVTAYSTDSNGKQSEISTLKIHK